MRFDLVTHDPDALFNQYCQAATGPPQAVIEADDAERQQTSKRRDARSMDAAGINPQGSTADEHKNYARMPRLLVWKQSGRVGTTATSVLYAASRDTGSGAVPKARATARPLYSSSSP